MGNRELALEITGRQACVMAQQIHRSRITVLCYPVIFMLWAVCGIVQASAILDTPTPTPCAPEIQITHIPSYGTYDDVRGVLTCAGSPHEYKIAVYIWVPELWWTKPSYDNPCLTPAADGSWSCDITSGGCDPYAFRIAAFLLPGDALCPVARGTADLPSELETLALASHVVDCSPGPCDTLVFSGRNWKVKESPDCPAGPGPNLFACSNAFVDEEGYLHLQITKSGDIFTCAEVICEDEGLGYGTYFFHTKGRVDILDPNVTLGLFTWDPHASYPYREIDIEGARWGNKEDRTNFQFVIQPHEQQGNLDRFTLDLSEGEDAATFAFCWQPGSVTFASYRGHHFNSLPEDQLIHRTVMVNSSVPVPGREQVRINLWLDGGRAPQNDVGEEVIVARFGFVPEYVIPTPTPHPVVHFVLQPSPLITNLGHYPICGVFENALRVTVNNEAVALDQFGGFRRDVVLSPGDNDFMTSVTLNDQRRLLYNNRIIYDPDFSTSESALLYVGQENSIVIALDRKAVLGFLNGARITGLTPDHEHIVTSTGTVYDTSFHHPTGLVLPFQGTGVYPAFSPDGQYCFSANRKIRMSDGQIEPEPLPISVDGRYCTITRDSLIQESGGFWKRINWETGQIEQETTFTQCRNLAGWKKAGDSCHIGLSTSYSWGTGCVLGTDLLNGQTRFQVDGLSDYSAQIALDPMGGIALIGSYGNSYYGGGGLTIQDLRTFGPPVFWKQFGAAIVASGPDNRIYISSRCTDHFANGTLIQGHPSHRGIEVLRLVRLDRLEPEAGYYLNTPHNYMEFLQTLLFVKQAPPPLIPGSWSFY